MQHKHSCCIVNICTVKFMFTLSLSLVNVVAIQRPDVILQPKLKKKMGGGGGGEKNDGLGTNIDLSIAASVGIYLHGAAATD